VTLPLGVLASARVAAGGPTSPISVVEEQFTTFAANGPQTVTFSSTVQDGDKVLIVYGCHRASSIRVISTVTGTLAATWSLLVTHTGQISAWIGENVTSNGTVIITQNSAALMTAHLYLIRGLSSRAVTSSLVNLTTGALETASSTAANGQIAVGWMCGFDATLANDTQFPGTQVPGSGWDVNAVNHNGVSAFGSSWRIPTATTTATHSAQAEIGSGDAGYLGMLVLGDANYQFKDSFNRADGAMGANWALITGTSALVISSNAVASPDANTNHMRNTTVSSSADTWTQAKMTVSGASMGVGARFPGTAVETGYIWRYNGSDCQLFAVSAGSYSSIGSSYAAVLAAGSILRIECQGTTIRGLVDGVVRATTTNSSVTTAGVGTLRIGGTAGRFDDFAMGSL
jgi:hypothetical protein